MFPQQTFVPPISSHCRSTVQFREYVSSGEICIVLVFEFERRTPLKRLDPIVFVGVPTSRINPYSSRFIRKFSRQEWSVRCFASMVLRAALIDKRHTFFKFCCSLIMFSRSPSPPTLCTQAREIIFNLRDSKVFMLQRYAATLASGIYFCFSLSRILDSESFSFPMSSAQGFLSVLTPRSWYLN